MTQRPFNVKTRGSRLSWSDQAGVVMLLLFYVTAFVYSPPGMPHVHHEEDIHHGDSCAKDACHISIFHPGGIGACDHKFHFTQTVEDCDLCHSLMPRQFITTAPVYAEFKIEFSRYSSSHTLGKFTAPYVLESDRGPPSLM